MQIADPTVQERDKYAEIWSTIPEYRVHSPGLENVDRFMSVMRPPQNARIIDLGCGEGVAGLAFEERGLDAWWLDITDAGLKAEVDRTRFIAQALWRPIPGRYRYGFCCDVLEHLPPEYTMLAVANILAVCEIAAWLQIALRPDEFGKAIGQPLHLTVRPFTWWRDRLATLGTVLEARDLCGDGLFVVSAKC